jgi:hypothetical protein
MDNKESLEATPIPEEVEAHTKLVTALLGRIDEVLDGSQANVCIDALSNALVNGIINLVPAELREQVFNKIFMAIKDKIA